MRKIVILACIIMLVLLCTGCNDVVSEEPIDVEYIAAYDAQEMTYGYKYDWWHGDFKYLPEYKKVHHDEEYKVQYEQVWSDGSTTTYWKTVSKSEYEDALKVIEKGGTE